MVRSNMNKKKNVTIFCDYFGNGGIEKVIQYIQDKINHEKYNINVLCTINNSQIYEFKGISMSKLKTANPFYRFIKTCLNIKKYTKNTEIIHINIHSPIGLFYAFLLKKENKQIIVHAHNCGFDKNYLKYKNIIASIFKFLFLDKQNIYIACSVQAASFCFGKRIKANIIKNEIIDNEISYNPLIRERMRKEYKIQPGEIVIGNIGRFTEQKNQSFVIDIVNALYNEGIDVKTLRQNFS